MEQFSKKQIIVNKQRAKIIKVKNPQVQENNSQSPQSQQTQLNYKVIKIYEDPYSGIKAATISKNKPYIAVGIFSKVLIWDYEDQKLIKQIDTRDIVYQLKFSEDSKKLFIATQDLSFVEMKNIIQDGKLQYYEKICFDGIPNLILTSKNQIILSVQNNKRFFIMLYDIQQKNQISNINPHNWMQFGGIDYDQDLNMIATGSVDLSIKLWHAEQGFQILEKQNSHGGKINQVLFIKKQKQIISSDQCGTLKIWKINYEREDLEELKQIREEDGIYNMSLMKNCQFFIIISKEYVKLYSIQGEYIDQFCNYLQISSFQQTIQLESMEGIIIFDKSNYQVYKIGKVKLYKEIKQK